MRCGAAERGVGAPVVLVAVCLALFAAGASAQAPVLRIGSSSVEGARVAGATLFPARALTALGFRLASNVGVTTAILGADTLHFYPTSPFFRAGGGVHQLAHPAQEIVGSVYLPEQFFIQWLPNTWPDRYDYRGGVLALKSAGPAPAARPAPPDPAAQARAEARRAMARTRVVVIDPGHGGRDPGRIGPNGLAEKDVTLVISQRLASALRARGYEVHLTRTTDTLIALADRPRLANRWRGDRPVAVFLSIHANAAPSRTARGFETFFLSEARTDDERRVAEMENESIRFEDTPAGPATNGLDRILSDMRSDILMRASHDLAAATQQKLAAFHPGPNRGVKRAGFYVLVGAIMPAVLIETAFISNRDEATLLGSHAFQQKIAWGIADSVDEFFRRNEHLWVDGP